MRKASHLIKHAAGLKLLPALTVLGMTLFSAQTAEAVELRTPTLWDLFKPSQPQVSPNTLEELIDHIRHGNESATSLKERFGDRIAESAKALRYLADRFASEGTPKQAKEMYEASIALKPNTENLTAMARFLLSQGDEEGWLKTMERRLDLPFDLWNDTITNFEIAYHFIDQGEWEKALPYAEAAAMRGDNAAYNLAAWLNGALGNTQQGLALSEQNALHNLSDCIATYVLAFGATPSDWTNQLLDYYYEAHSHGTPIERARCVSIALLQEKYDEAVSLMEWSLQQSNDPWYGLHAAFICEEQGWIERRDQILQEAVKRWPRFPNPNRNRKNTKACIDLYIQANQTQELSDELKAKLQHLFDSCGRGKSAFNGAYAGELCRLRGEPEMAKEMYCEIISVKRLNNVSDYVAFRGLRLLGEDPVKILQTQRNVIQLHTEMQPSE